MIKTEIYIENNKVDITEDISTLITYSIDDIKDFSSRNTSFSKTIVLPGTANNNKIFGGIFEPSAANNYSSLLDNVLSNFNASIGADCIIFQDHIQVFKGTLRILEIVITNGQVEYECAVFGELSGLIYAMGNGKLEDLDFSVYDHVWNTTNIQNSWDGVANSTGYFYPLIDYGTVSEGKADWDIRAFRPAFKVREYIDKMITGAGYKWESDLFNTARFKSLIIPNNQKTFQRSTYNLINASRATSANIIDSGTSTNVTITYSSFVEYFFSHSAGVFTYTGTDPVITTCSVSFTGSYIGNSTGYTLRLYKNGVEDTSFRKTIPQTSDTNTYFFNWVYSGNESFVTTDTIELRAVATGTPAGTDNIRLIAGNFKVDSNTSVLVDLSPGNTISVNETLPRNILQKDFFTSIIKLFNLYVYEDQYTAKKLFIKPYVDFYNASGFNDWTYKMDRSKPIGLKPMSELNSRFYSFEFKKDSDYFNERYVSKYNENYGSYIYDSEFQFVNDSNKVELIFSPTVLVGYSGADKIVSVIYKLNAGVEERMDSNIRILQSKKITSVSSWSIKDGTSTLSGGLTDYGYAGHYDDPDAPANDLQFGVPKELFFTLASGAVNVTQFNVYWSPYMAEIADKDSKLLTAFFKLTSSDIHGLDFSDFIYIDGVLFRINKIEDWNATELDVCKCELLKVINTSY